MWLVFFNSSLDFSRVDVEFTEENNAVVTWLEETAEEAILMMKVVSPKGQVLQEEIFTNYNPKRASGFPRIAMYKGACYIGYTNIIEDLPPTLEMIRLKSSTF